jgi:hypothetical protein
MPVDTTAYNMRLKKREKMQNVHIKSMKSKRGVRYAITGVGSDGTKMIKFISKDDYDELKAQGYKGGNACGATSDPESEMEYDGGRRRRRTSSRKSRHSSKSPRRKRSSRSRSRSRGRKH